MYRVFPTFSIIKIVVFFIAILYLFVFQVTGATFNYLSILEITTYVSVLFFIIMWIIGKFAWKLLWRFPLTWLKNTLNEKICPDLEGEWTGIIKSNYSSPPTEKTVNIKIEANFFYISLKLLTDDQYSSSHTIMSVLSKNQHSEEFELFYLYRNITNKPVESDERQHYGSGLLKVVFDANKNITLEGHYWTDRLWFKKLNTAGQITLERKK